MNVNHGGDEKNKNDYTKNTYNYKVCHTLYVDPTGGSVNLLTIDIPTPTHPDRHFWGQKRGSPHRGVTPFYF